MTEGRKKKGKKDTRVLSDKARIVEERALAKGVKPFKSVKDAATMRPEDADELLAAIRLLREDDKS